MKIENGEPPKTTSFPLKFALHWFFPLWNKTKFIHISYFSRCLSAFVPWYPKIYPTFRLPPASHDANQSWFTATGRQQKSKEHENWKKKQQILVNPLYLVNMSLFLYIIKTPGENVNLPSKIQEVPWKYELTGAPHFLMRTWTPQNWHVKEQLWWNKKTGHKQQNFEKQIWIQCNKSSCGWKSTRMNPSNWHSERHVGWSTEQPL